MSSLLEDWLWEELEEGASLLSEEVSLEEGAEEEDGVEDDSLEEGSDEGVSEDASLEAGSDDFSLDEGGSLLGVSEEGMEDSVSDVPFELEGCSLLVCSVWLEEGGMKEDSRCDETASLEEAALEEAVGAVPHAKSVKAAKQLRSRFFFIASHYPKFPRMGKKKRAGSARVKGEIAYLSL